MKPNPVVSRIIDLMNEALAADPEAMSKLCFQRVGCNEELAKHPSIQVHKEEDGHSVGLIGLLNGIAGADPDGWGYVAAVLDEGKKLVRFELRQQSPVAESQETLAEQPPEQPAPEQPAPEQAPDPEVTEASERVQQVLEAYNEAATSFQEIAEKLEKSPLAKTRFGSEMSAKLDELMNMLNNEEQRAEIIGDALEG